MSKEEIKDARKANEERKKQMQLRQKHSQRITIARHGRDAFSNGEYVFAVKKYTEYLNIHAMMNERDIFNITPDLFDSKKDVTELLLISHIYWDLSRIYEMTPKFKENYIKAVNQFVVFTVNQQYQVLNAEMLRKYIKANKNKSPYIAELEKSLQKIFVDSKKCYIASHCFGENHLHTNNLREIKNYLNKSDFGIEIIRNYYLVSHNLVTFLENKRSLSLTLKLLTKPILTVVANIIRLRKL